MSPQSIEEKGKSENMLSGALKSLFAVSENYPDLKANQNFLELQKNFLIRRIKFKQLVVSIMEMLET